MRVNQDALATITKCKSKATELLKGSKSVIVDNTNLFQSTRFEWINLARALNVSIRAVHIDVTPELCRHLYQFRFLNPHGLVEDNRKTLEVPEIAIREQWKAYSDLKALHTEGYDHVDSVEFYPVMYEDPETDVLFRQYLVAK